MENLYNYVLWYNHHTDMWYAIPRSNYNDFFNNISETEGVFIDKSLAALINGICNI